MSRHPQQSKPCPAIHDGVPCGGEMTFEPRQYEVRPTLADPIGEQGHEPCWSCGQCGKVEWVDDDPGTGSMFGGAE